MERTMNDKPTALPSPPPNELRKFLEQAKRNFNDHVEYVRLCAKMERETFQAYVEAGFTDAQALELLKASKVRAHL
jgi:hypothetical protein